MMHGLCCSDNVDHAKPKKGCKAADEKCIIKVAKQAQKRGFQWVFSFFQWVVP